LELAKKTDEKAAEKKNSNKPKGPGPPSYLEKRLFAKSIWPPATRDLKEVEWLLKRHGSVLLEYRLFEEHTIVRGPAAKEAAAAASGLLPPATGAKPAAAAAKAKPPPARQSGDGGETKKEPADPIPPSLCGPDGGPNWFSAIDLAAATGDVPLLRALLELCCDSRGGCATAPPVTLERREARAGRTPLHIAAMRGHDRVREAAVGRRAHSALVSRVYVGRASSVHRCIASAFRSLGTILLLRAVEAHGCLLASPSRARGVARGSRTSRVRESRVVARANRASSRARIANHQLHMGHPALPSPTKPTHACAPLDLDGVRVRRSSCTCS
jgi:hypothetical protein